MKASNTQLTNAVAVVLTALVMVLFWKIVGPDYATNKNTLEVVRSDTAAAKEKLDSINTAKLQMDEISGVVDEFLVSISDEPDEPDILSEIEAIGKKNGLAVPSISIDYDEAGSGAVASDSVSSDLFSSSDMSGEIRPVSIAFSVVGGFDQVSSFLASMEESLKFFEVTSLNYSVSEEGDIAMAVSAQAFFRGSNESSVAGY